MVLLLKEKRGSFLVICKKVNGLLFYWLMSAPCQCIVVVSYDPMKTEAQGAKRSASLPINHLSLTSVKGIKLSNLNFFLIFSVLNLQSFINLYVILQIVVLSLATPLFKQHGLFYTVFKYNYVPKGKLL